LEALREKIRALKDTLLDIDIHMNADTTMQLGEAHRDLIDTQRKFFEVVSHEFGQLRTHEEAWSTSVSDLLGQFYDG
jgi:hypothetical protein